MNHRYTYRDCQELRRRRHSQRLMLITVGAWTLLLIAGILFAVLP